MSKGKQWWPLQASINDEKTTLADFQERLRQKKWLRRQEGVKTHYVYVREGVYPPHADTVNDYMQFSASDTAAKNQARVTILRLLCDLMKWHTLLKPQAILTEPPVVFLTPSLQTHTFLYGVMAQLNHQGKNLTLVVSEQNLGHDDIKAKHWVSPQHGDSYGWMTLKTWQDQRQLPSFSKWVFAAKMERRTWIETLPKSEEMFDGLGLIAFDGVNAARINALKFLGAVYRHSDKKWFLPAFYEKTTVLAWLELNASNPLFQAQTKQAYKPSKEYFAAHHNNAVEISKEYTGAEKHEDINSSSEPKIPN